MTRDQKDLVEANRGIAGMVAARYHVWAKGEDARAEKAESE